MFKIQFRVQRKSFGAPMYCKIIDTLTLWNIEVNKYMMCKNRDMIFPTVYSKYKNLFNNEMFPVNYSGKIMSYNSYNSKFITLLQNGKLHGNEYSFYDNHLYIEKYYMDKLNKSIKVINECYTIENLSSHRYFYFTETGKLEFLINTLMKTEFEFYLNGKIKSYSNYHIGKKFKFTEN